VSSETSTPRQVIAAWAVHAFTMTGVVWACLAVAALFAGDIRQMWLWLGVALIVDGLDGTLARKAQVSVHAPTFDGTTLDSVVDYLTWTFIPALFMYLHLPFGGPRIGLVAFIVITASSLFCYCNKRLKTEDYYFVGFPAAWNIVAVAMWLLGTGAVFNIVATLVLAVLTLAPITFVHPFRVGTLMVVNIVATFAWVAATVGLVLTHPERPVWLELAWWVSGGWLMVISGWRSGQEMGRRWRTGRSVSSLG